MLNTKNLLTLFKLFNFSLAYSLFLIAVISKSIVSSTTSFCLLFSNISSIFSSDISSATGSSSLYSSIGASSPGKIGALSFSIGENSIKLIIDQKKTIQKVIGGYKKEVIRKEKETLGNQNLGSPNKKLQRSLSRYI